jgi:RsiW-degrading membrane proteinase PrsW (M82 family)
MSEPAEPITPPEVKTPVDALVEKTADEVRKQPVKSVVWAFFIGVILAAFPLGRVIGGLTNLVFVLLRPLLLVLGVVKVCEEIEERRK